MKKKVLNYIHFTKSELDGYTRDKSSCVEKVNNSMHIGFPPWGMGEDFKESLLNAVSAKKIGLFDAELNGIVLDVRNIKLNGEMSLVRYDTPELHLTIRADFYVFRPQVGAILRGVVKFNSQKHISVLIYRVFNVSIRLGQMSKKQKLQLGSEITFRVKKFDLQNILPYIEGELVDTDGLDSGISTSEEKSQPEVRKPVVTSSDSSHSDTESESEKELKPSLDKIVIPEVKKRVTSSESENSESESDSEKEFKAAVPAVGSIKTQEAKKVVSTDDSSSSDSDSDSDTPINDSQSSRQNTTVVVKKEPFKSPSPEKPSTSKGAKQQQKKVLVKAEPEDEEDYEMELPINRQIDELINRYSHSEDTDTSGNSFSRKKAQNSKKIAPLPVKSLPAQKKRLPTPPPVKRKPPSSSSSSDDEEFTETLDMNTSISALLAKVKQEKISTPEATSKASAAKKKKKLHDDTASQSFGSPQLSSTKVVDFNKSKEKKNSHKKKAK